MPHAAFRLARRLAPRLALSLLLVMLPLRGLALCQGVGLFDQLAPEQRATVTEQAAAIPFGAGLIWQARKGDRVLDVIGTMHLADPRHDVLLGDLKPVVAAADLLLLEVSPEEQAQLETRMRSDPDLLYRSTGPTLAEELPAPVWEALRHAASARGVPSFLAAKMRPWFLSVLLSIPICAMDELTQGDQGLDGRLMRFAQDQGVPVGGVESHEVVFDLFAALPRQEALDFIKLSLMGGGETEALFVSLLGDYFAGRTGRFMALSRHAVTRSPGMDPDEALALYDRFMALLLDGRNRSWIPAITAATAENAHVVLAVGAAHLPGDQGVLRLLEAEGWQIAPHPVAPLGQ